MQKFNPSKIQSLSDELFKTKQVQMFVLRDDLINPFISGNKWRKLKYNVEEFKKSGKSHLLTFGGAYSNHIIATSAAGKEFGFQTIGIIRGEELNPHSNSSLRFAQDNGMKLFFVSRTDYRKREEENFISTLIASSLKLKEEDVFVLPEGGMGKLAMKGCAEIIDDLTVEFDSVCVACGTGTTLAGIASALNGDRKAIGISVLDDREALKKNISLWIGEKSFQIIHDYDFGGYHKSKPELDNFCKEFYSKHGIEIEPTYTGKLFYGLYDLIKKDYFKPGASIVAIHTGGVFEWTKLV